MTITNFGPARVKYIPKDVSGEVIEISLWYKGKPESQWIAVKFFQSSRDVVTGMTVDMSDPFKTKREDIRMTASRPLKKGDIVYITCKSDMEQSEPEKDGARIVKGGKQVEKFTFNLNDPDEIEIVTFAATENKPTEDSIPIAV